MVPVFVVAAAVAATSTESPERYMTNGDVGKVLVGGAAAVVIILVLVRADASYWVVPAAGQ